MSSLCRTWSLRCALAGAVDCVASDGDYGDGGDDDDACCDDYGCDSDGAGFGDDDDDSWRRGSILTAG